MIKIFDLPVDVKHFSDGAIQVSLTEEIIQLLDDKIVDDSDVVFDVSASIKSNDDLIALLQTKECLTNNYCDLNIHLDLKYTPYARSDRAMTSVSCGGFKTIAPLINSLGAKCVHVYDPHSDVVEALLKEVTINSQLDCVNNLIMGGFLNIDKVDYLVSPDAGAFKKCLKTSEVLQKPLIEAGKIRELGTNKILKSTIYTDVDLKGKTVLILDDICEYGTTHKELAEVLKQRGASKVLLYVTHGIFPVNKRIEPHSRFDYVLSAVDEIYIHHLWENSETTEINSCVIPFEIV